MTFFVRCVFSVLEKVSRDGATVEVRDDGVTGNVFRIESLVEAGEETTVYSGLYILNRTIEGGMKNIKKSFIINKYFLVSIALNSAVCFLGALHTLYSYFIPHPIFKSPRSTSLELKQLICGL